MEIIGLVIGVAVMIVFEVLHACFEVLQAVVLLAWSLARPRDRPQRVTVSIDTEHLARLKRHVTRHGGRVTRDRGQG